MSLLDLGFTFDEAKKETKSDFPAIPEAVYDITVVDASEKTWEKSGDKYLNFQLSIMNSPDASMNNRRIFYTVTLDGKPFSKKLLVDIVTGLGEQWTGTQLDPQVLVGLTGRVKVVNRRDKDTGDVVMGNDGNPQINAYFQRR